MRMPDSPNVSDECQEHINDAEGEREVEDLDSDQLECLIDT